MYYKNRSVGFIICVYRGDRVEFLEEMLQSIDEVVLTEGCELRVFLHVDGEISSDCERVIEKAKLYKVVRSAENVGLAIGLNRLIPFLTNEDFIFRLDADDLMRPERIIKQMAFMDKNPQIDFCGGSIDEFNNNKENVVNSRKYPLDMKSIKKTFPKSSPFAHVTICFRNDFFDKFGNYPTNYPLNEDIALWATCLRKGALGANIPDVIVDVRMDYAYSRRTTKKAIGEFKVFFMVSKWCKRGYIYPFLRLFFRLFPTKLVMFIYNSKLRKSFLEK